MTYTRFLGILWAAVTTLLVALAVLDSLNQATFSVAFAVLIVATIVSATDDDLDGGDLALDVESPTRMKLGETYRLRTIIGSQIFDVVENVPNTVRATIRADANHFRILELNSAEQSISPTRNTVWEYDVTPLKRGTRSLRFLITSVASASAPSVRDLSSMDQEVTVLSNPSFQVTEFWVNNWKWLVTTFGIPLFTWLAAESGLISLGFLGFD